ncbi:MAG: hypothetical protein Q9216_003600 [Gyalolechia sp. 2 TL-2023]
MSSSQSSQIKFSGIGDPNDPKALADALAKIKIGKPESYGGVMRDPSNANVVFDSFDIHTPPDIPSNTRIVAVLGIINGQVNPTEDGWFLSDFMAFWHIFQGLTQHQSWFHCLDLDLAVQLHTRFLHGNPYKKRKVVLDNAILQQTKSARDQPQHFSETDLYHKFCAKLKDECEAAEKTGANVLVLMFGHGEQQNFGIYLGSRPKPFKQSAFRYAMKGLNAQVTMLTTQCYGGGWTCMPAINFSAWAYAGKDRTSKSWRYSGSCGRACGSMFATAIIGELTLDPLTGKSLVDAYETEEEGAPPIPLTEEQAETYTQLCGSVYKSLLLNVDRRGMTHGLSFTAQDDAWGICWSRRTGIPLAAYKKRWDDLPDWEADVTLHPGDPLNRDPHVTAEQEAEYYQLEALTQGGEGKGKHPSSLGAFEATGSVQKKRKTSGLYGGTMDGLIANVKVLATDYLRSYPGRENDDTADDGPLHNAIHWILQDRICDEEKVEWTLRNIRYRMELQETTDRYVEIMQIPAPFDKKCCEFDTRQVKQNLDWNTYFALFGLIGDRQHVLFPHPNSTQQGGTFYKGHDYLIATFHLTKLSKDAVIEKLDMLVEVIKFEVQQQKEIVKRDPEVQRKRRRLYNAYDISGAMSPKKRMSLSA